MASHPEVWVFASGAPRGRHGSEREHAVDLGALDGESALGIDDPVRAREPELHGAVGQAKAEVLVHAWLYRGGLSWIADPVLRSHAFAIATIAFWWAVLRFFEKRGWFWKI